MCAGARLIFLEMYVLIVGWVQDTFVVELIITIELSFQDLGGVASPCNVVVL